MLTRGEESAPYDIAKQVSFNTTFHSFDPRASSHLLKHFITSSTCSTCFVSVYFPACV